MIYFSDYLHLDISLLVPQRTIHQPSLSYLWKTIKRYLNQNVCISSNVQLPCNNPTPFINPTMKLRFHHYSIHWLVLLKVWKNHGGEESFGNFWVGFGGVFVWACFPVCIVGHGKWHTLLWALPWRQFWEHCSLHNQIAKQPRHLFWLGCWLLTAAASSEKWGMAMVEDTVPSRTWDGYQGAPRPTALTAQGLHGPSFHFVETTISYIDILQRQQDHRNRKAMINKYKIISD